MSSCTEAMSQSRARLSFSDIRKTIQEGKVKKLRKLIEQGVISPKDKKYSLLLHVACSPKRNLNPYFKDKEKEKESIRIEILDLLIRKGWDVNAQDERSRTPLCLSVIEGDQEIVKKLLDKGADPNSKDFKGRIPLYYAIEILRSEQDEKKRASYEHIIYFLLPKVYDVNMQDDRGDTLLHLAIYLGNEIIKKLLDNGADPNIKNKKGLSPFHVALNNYLSSIENKYKNEAAGWWEVVRLLKEKGTIS